MHKYRAELTWRKILFDRIAANAQVRYWNRLAWLPVMEGVWLGFKTLPKTFKIKRGV